MSVRAFINFSYSIFYQLTEESNRGRLVVKREATSVLFLSGEYTLNLSTKDPGADDMGSNLGITK